MIMIVILNAEHIRCVVDPLYFLNSVIIKLTNLEGGGTGRRCKEGSKQATTLAIEAGKEHRGESV
jgi:hypothetical protein